MVYGMVHSMMYGPQHDVWPTAWPMVYGMAHGMVYGPQHDVWSTAWPTVWSMTHIMARSMAVDASTRTATVLIPLSEKLVKTAMDLLQTKDAEIAQAEAIIPKR